MHSNKFLVKRTLSDWLTDELDVISEEEDDDDDEYSENDLSLIANKVEVSGLFI